MHSELQNYPEVLTIPVAWGEMDSFGHVNNTIYFRYFETGRMSYFMKMTARKAVLAKVSVPFLRQQLVNL